MRDSIGKVHGRVSKWTEKGYGFVRDDDGRELFVHVSELRRGDELPPLPGEGCYFTVEEGPKGLRARGVVFESDGL